MDKRDERILLGFLFLVICGLLYLFYWAWDQDQQVRPYYSAFDSSYEQVIADLKAPVLDKEKLRLDLMQNSNDAHRLDHYYNHNDRLEDYEAFLVFVLDAKDRSEDYGFENDSLASFLIKLHKNTHS